MALSKTCAKRTIGKMSREDRIAFMIDTLHTVCDQDEIIKILLHDTSSLLHKCKLCERKVLMYHTRFSETVYNFYSRYDGSRLVRYSSCCMSCAQNTKCDICDVSIYQAIENVRVYENIGYHHITFDSHENETIRSIRCNDHDEKMME